MQIVLIAAEIGLLFVIRLRTRRFGQQPRSVYGPNRLLGVILKLAAISLYPAILEKIVCRFSVRQVTMLLFSTLFILYYQM